MTDVLFKINPQLTIMLSKDYRSTEKALKELVDNAWDADASVVDIYLPESMTLDPIIIKDDGVGMTKEELSNDYLHVANNRRNLRGSLTRDKKRQVKGRKGIGKFSGLLAARRMKVETWSKGNKSELEFDEEKLSAWDDLSDMPIDLTTKVCGDDVNGTCITLSGLYQHLAFPHPDKLRQLLIQEYGREEDFKIIINGKQLDIDDIQKEFFEVETDVPDMGDVKFKLAISDKKTSLRNPGIVIRVGGKVIGEPFFLGLDESNDFPLKLLKKCYGVIDADSLLNDVTADGGAIIENSEGLKVIIKTLQPILRAQFEKKYQQEINLAKARLAKDIKRRLSELPEHKRQYADEAISKILKQFFQETDEKISPIVNVLLDAMERTEYRTVLNHIDEAEAGEVCTIAKALDDFGLFEMSKMIEQVNSRLKFLDKLEDMCSSPDTLEKDVHIAIEHNLWVLDPAYTVFSSNRTLKNMVERLLNDDYAGSKGHKRPDLMLNQNVQGGYLLIELKRPTHVLNYSDYQQVTAYRSDFRRHTQEKIEIWLLGGKKGSDLPVDHEREANTQIVLYSDLISTASRQLDWLLSELKNNVR